MYTSTLFTLLAATATVLASPVPAVDAAAAVAEGKCFYITSVPNFIAFTGLVPNPNESQNGLDTIFNNYSFGCKNGKNFTASILTSSTVNPKPWFVGDEYDLRVYPNCNPDAIANLVTTAITTNNSGANGTVTCVKYDGSTTNPFQKATSQYFNSIQGK